MGAAAQTAEAATLEPAAEISVAAWEHANETQATASEHEAKEPTFGGNLKATLASSSWASAQQKSEAKVSAAKRVMDEALAAMSDRTSGAQNNLNYSETEK